MQSIVEATNNLLAQQWSILSAYFAVLAAFQFRIRHLPLNMAGVARHAVWAAGIVITVHSLSREVWPVAFEGRVFAGTLHVLITISSVFCCISSDACSRRRRSTKPGRE